MSQKKVYLYSPDGKEEGWHMEDAAPAGWVSSDPNESDIQPAKEDEPVIETEVEELARLQAELDAMEAAEKPSGKQNRKNKH